MITTYLYGKISWAQLAPTRKRHKFLECYSKTRNYLYTNARARLETSPAAVGSCSLTNCKHIFGFYYKNVSLIKVSRWVSLSLLTQKVSWKTAYLCTFCDFFGVFTALPVGNTQAKTPTDVFSNWRKRGFGVYWVRLGTAPTAIDKD